MKRITFFILSILCFTACNNDINIDKPETDAPQIRLIMPDAKKVEVYSSTATENECKIEKMWVFAFRGTTKIFSEEIDVAKITKNDQESQLLPQLKNLSLLRLNDRIVCIANVLTAADTAAVTSSSLNTLR